MQQLKTHQDIEQKAKKMDISLHLSEACYTYHNGDWKADVSSKARFWLIVSFWNTYEIFGIVTRGGLGC